jgi:hypothetical protein
MTAPPFSAATRFIDAGTSRIYWVQAIANTAAPTRSELDAGTDVTGEVAEIEGFTLESELNNTQAFAQTFATNKPGALRAAGNPRTVMYADQGGYDVRRLWARGDAGHIVLLHGGDVAGNLMDVWPVTIAVVSKPFSMADAAFVLVQFAIPTPPVVDVEVP